MLKENGKENSSIGILFGQKKRVTQVTAF